MSCAAAILSALDSTKPKSVNDTDTFLNTVASAVVQAVVNYISASITTACVYSGAVVGSGTGVFSALVPSLMVDPFKAGLKSRTNVNNAISQGFASGLHAMLCAGTVTEAASGIIVATGVPINFTGIGSAHTASVPSHSACSSALSRMTTEKPAAGTNPRAEEVKKLKLMANSFAKIIDDFIPTIAIVTAGAGASGLGSAIASTPAVDPSFPA
jgi:hypothetical protein